jgi:hypothetical protein
MKSEYGSELTFLNPLMRVCLSCIVRVPFTCLGEVLFYLAFIRLLVMFRSLYLHVSFYPTF